MRKLTRACSEKLHGTDLAEAGRAVLKTRQDLPGQESTLWACFSWRLDSPHTVKRGRPKHEQFSCSRGRQTIRLIKEGRSAARLPLYLCFLDMGFRYHRGGSLV